MVFREVKKGLCKNILRQNTTQYFTDWGRETSVGRATCYGLDGPGIESRWERDFPRPSTPALRPTQPPVQWAPGISRGKWGGAGRGVALTTHPHLAPRLKKEYRYTSSPPLCLRGLFYSELYLCPLQYLNVLIFS